MDLGKLKARNRFGLQLAKERCRASMLNGRPAQFVLDFGLLVLGLRFFVGPNLMHAVVRLGCRKHLTWITDKVQNWSIERSKE